MNKILRSAPLKVVLTILLVVAIAVAPLGQVQRADAIPPVLVAIGVGVVVALLSQGIQYAVGCLWTGDCYQITTSTYYAWDNRCSRFVGPSRMNGFWVNARVQTTIGKLSGRVINAQTKVFCGLSGGVRVQ